jgi:hypothetical protein
VTDDAAGLYDDPDSAGGYEFDDPEEFHRIRRLEQIHDARERFDSGRHKIYHAADIGEITPERAQNFTAQLALDFVRQLEPLLRRTDADLLEREIELPTDGSSVSATVERLLDENGTVAVNRTEKQMNPETNAKETVQITDRVTMTRRASARLVRLGDDFLEEIMPAGIVEDSDDDADLEYADLV